MPLNDTDSPLDLKTLSIDELERLMDKLGQPKFRARQISDWILKKHVATFDEMTNLPVSLREQLAQSCVLGSTHEIAKQISRDGSRKYLLAFGDGIRAECVGRLRLFASWLSHGLRVLCNRQGRLRPLAHRIRNL